jgi:hypothetical protein
MSEIQTAVGLTPSSPNGTSLREYNRLAGKAAPDIMQEFYGYGAPAVTPATPSVTPAPNVTPFPTPAPNVTPAFIPPVSFTVSSACNGTTTTSTEISITNIINGGDVYIGYSTDPGSPVTIAKAIGTTAGHPGSGTTSFTITGVPDRGGSSWYVAVYNDSTGGGAVSTVAGRSCYVAPSVTPAVPSPTPAPVYRIELSYGATSCEAKQNYPQQ